MGEDKDNKGSEFIRITLKRIQNARLMMRVVGRTLREEVTESGWSYGRGVSTYTCGICFCDECGRIYTPTQIEKLSELFDKYKWLMTYGKMDVRSSKRVCEWKEKVEKVMKEARRITENHD